MLKGNEKQFKFVGIQVIGVNFRIYGRFAYGSFHLWSVCLRLEAIRLHLICQFTYVLKHVSQQLIHLLYARSRLDASQSIQFLKRDFVCWINQLNINRPFGAKLTFILKPKIKPIEAKITSVPLHENHHFNLIHLHLSKNKLCKYRKFWVSNYRVLQLHWVSMKRAHFATF